MISAGNEEMLFERDGKGGKRLHFGKAKPLENGL